MFNLFLTAFAALRGGGGGDEHPVGLAIVTKTTLCGLLTIIFLRCIVSADGTEDLLKHSVREYGKGQL